MEREQFLGRVRAALRGAVLPGDAGPDGAPEVRCDDPVTRFLDQAQAAGAEVTRVDDPAGALEAVAAVMDGDERYVGWDDLEPFVPSWGLHATSRGWENIDAAVGVGNRAADEERIGGAKVGITGADAAIAATGTVVLAHGPGRPRAASLLVERHVVLLPATRIVQSLHDALGVVDWTSTSNLVAITGPSRTGDIESILTLGVHGPRHLHIVLIG